MAAIRSDGPGAILRLAVLAAAGAAVALPVLFRGAGEATGFSPSDRKNPHLEGACEDCHAKVPDKGKSSAAEVLAGLRTEPVALCRDCHPESEVSHHPVVRKTDRKLPPGLPLGAGGEVICSTCHDVHMRAPVRALLRGYDSGRYSVRMDMCVDCHAENFRVLNPHHAGTESEKCYSCHPAKPGAADTGSTVRLQENLAQVCDFCHNVREKAHPHNVDTLKKLPESLPRGPGGEHTCGTCHDPHGTSRTLHFLRKAYVDHIEAGRYNDPHARDDYAGCLGCHLAMATRPEEMRGNLRYGGDDLLLCHSCHGAMDACHPILVTPPPHMKPGRELPLSRDGKMTCLTCHDPTQAGRSGVAIRGRKPADAVNAVCYRCHDRADLAGRNPHSSMSDRTSCKFCHDTMTDPTNEEAARVSFISNTRLICLRCHAQEFHPMGKDHMVIPKLEVPPAFRLDVGGRLTCTSCHNPHIDTRTEEGKRRKPRFVVDVEGASLCSLCHKR